MSRLTFKTGQKAILKVCDCNSDHSTEIVEILGQLMGDEDMLVFRRGASVDWANIKKFSPFPDVHMKHRFFPKYKIHDEVIADEFAILYEEKQVTFERIIGKVIGITIYASGILYDILKNDGTVEGRPESTCKKNELFIVYD